MEQTFSTPNAIVDRLLALLTPEEAVVLVYAIRRTRGFQKQRAQITIRQFTNGNGFDCGTGLGPAAVTKALTALDTFRVLMKVPLGGRSSGVEYQLQPNGGDVDWAGLEKRRGEREAASKSRTEKARESRCYVGHNNEPGLLCGTENSCYVPQRNVVMSDITIHVNTERKPEENQILVPSERAAVAAPVADEPPVATRRTAKTRDTKKDYTTQQALNIAVNKICARFVVRWRECWPDKKPPILQPGDRQAVRDAVKGIAAADGTDYLAAEREVTGYAEILAAQGTPLGKMRFELEDLRNGPKQHPSRGPGSYRATGGKGGGRGGRDERKAADGVAELDRIFGEAGIG